MVTVEYRWALSGNPLQLCIRFMPVIKYKVNQALTCFKCKMCLTGKYCWVLTDTPLQVRGSQIK